MASLGWKLCTPCLVAAVAAGCGGGDPRQSPPAGSPQRLDLGVVGVTARIGYHETLASGFVIDAARGLVLTSARAVWGARSLRLSTAFGILHGRIVARAPCDDLAVLQVHPNIPGLATLPSAPPAAPSNGQFLRSVGRRAEAIASIPVRASASRARDAAPLDSPLVPEVSGGPVVDEAGRLVGMAQPGTAPEPAVTIPWSQLRKRLAQLEPGVQQVYVGWAKQYRCARRQHAYARAAHPGFQPSDARLNAPIAPTRIPGGEGIDG